MHALKRFRHTQVTPFRSTCFYVLHAVCFSCCFTAFSTFCCLCLILILMFNPLSVCVLFRSAEHAVCQPWSRFLLDCKLGSGENDLLHPAFLTLITLVRQTTHTFSLILNKIWPGLRSNKSLILEVKIWYKSVTITSVKRDEYYGQVSSCWEQ